ncbi:unnamed protein product [Parajaminaea phylloscopi]
MRPVAGTVFAGLKAVLAVSALCSGLVTASPPVKVQLRAPWPAPPILLEALEAAAIEDPAAFHLLLSDLCGSEARTKDLASASSARGVYDAVTEALDRLQLLSGPGLRSSWDLALALHSQAPKVSAFWQLAKTTGAVERWKKHIETSSHTACQSWVDWYGQVVCDAEELENLIEKGQTSEGVSGSVREYPFDHIIAGNSGASDRLVAVLYADPVSSNFAQLYTTLHSQAALKKQDSSKPFQFILRWRPPATAGAQLGQNGGEVNALLTGYGATLDLKKVDYLVIDDRVLSHAKGAPELTADEGSASTARQIDDREWVDSQLGDLGRQELTEDLTPDELSTLGLQATQAILGSSDPVRMFAQLTQDFPLHYRRLARGLVKPSDALAEEIDVTQMTKIRPGAGDVWLNGRQLSTAEQVPLGLLKQLRSERGLMTSLMGIPWLNLSAVEAANLLSFPAVGQAQSTKAEAEVYFDASDRPERQQQENAWKQGSAEGDAAVDAPGAILWWNDIEKDSAFTSYDKSIRSLLRPSYPGQFPKLRKNLWNVVLILDLARPENCKFVGHHLMSAIDRVGLHFGFVPAGFEAAAAPTAEQSIAVARFYWHLVDNYGVRPAASFLVYLAQTSPNAGVVSIDDARKAFQRALALIGFTEDAASITLSVLREPNKREGGVRDYTRRLRLSMQEHPTGTFFLNGQMFPFTASNFFQLALQVVSIQTQQIARPIYFGDLTDDDDVSTYFYDLPTTYASRSELVFPRQGADSSVAGPKHKAVDLFRIWKQTRTTQQSDELIAASTPFISSPATSRPDTTVWLLTDLDTSFGAELVRQLARAQQSLPTFRFGFLHSPASNKSSVASPDSTASSFSVLIAHLAATGQLNSLTATQILEILDDLEDPSAQLSESKTSDPVSREPAPQVVFRRTARPVGWNEATGQQASKYWADLTAYIQGLDVAPGQSAIVVNGHLVAGIESLTVTAADLEALIRSEQARRIGPVREGVEALISTRLSELGDSEAADALALVSSVIGTAFYRDESQEGMFEPSNNQRSNIVDRLGVRESRFEFGDRENALLRFQVIVDPLAEVAQRWSSLFKLITAMPDAYLEVVLNPVRNVTEMPLKRFYRYSAPASLSFDPQTGADIPATLSFLGMPEDAVLTMGLDAPPAWLTMASEAVYDLDNIRLRDVPADGRSTGVVAVYDLKHLLIEGHCRDGQDIPRGLQLELQTADGSETLDTIVMANLAYFQFRARPGLYRLKIREGGKSEEVYKMVSVGNLGWDSPDVNVTGNDITLDSLDGLTIYPRVEKRPGMEDEDLLLDLEGDQMMMAESDAAHSSGRVRAKGVLQMAADTVKKMASPSKSDALATSTKSKQADINIFTVASGHLYERMTYIMILSVLRHTKSSVKFWFIENFLSPSFKEFIPHLSREYGFDYELVTYAWPHWLREQKEKQRTIWGYKILFLDVLFPLDLDKVIFVDSDQVVRHDLKDLIDVDLKGAPYGFPPMGDDSYDMDGYRFWKRGYWKDFLRGRPYHISALYVVDLVRFRSVAAGDRLRGQYQALSQDPNSLANLDQDLPQTLMFQLPIRTLDKTWLWCETWCSHDWLDQAKTIDLCSNPKTHEAKLDRARRQIPEWTELDDEVQRLATRVSEAQGGPVTRVKGQEGAAQAPAGDIVSEPVGVPEHHQRQHDEL